MMMKNKNKTKQKNCLKIPHLTPCVRSVCQVNGNMYFVPSTDFRNNTLVNLLLIGFPGSKDVHAKRYFRSKDECKA